MASLTTKNNESFRWCYDIVTIMTYRSYPSSPHPGGYSVCYTVHTFDLAHSNQNESCPPLDQASPPRCWAQENSVPNMALNIRAKIPSSLTVTSKASCTHHICHICPLFCAGQSHTQWLCGFSGVFCMPQHSTCFLDILLVWQHDVVF